MHCIALMAPSQSLFVILQPWVLCYHWPHLQNDLMITTCFDIRVLSSLPSFSSSPSPSPFTLAKSQTSAVGVIMHQLGWILWEKKCNTCSFVCSNPNTLRSYEKRHCRWWINATTFITTLIFAIVNITIIIFIIISFVIISTTIIMIYDIKNSPAPALLSGGK